MPNILPRLTLNKKTKAVKRFLNMSTNGKTLDCQGAVCKPYLMLRENNGKKEKEKQGTALELLAVKATGVSDTFKSRPYMKSL